MGTAVFYDAQNVKLNLQEINRIQALIQTSPLTDRIVLQRAYTVATNEKNSQELREALEENRIEAVELEAQISRFGKVKPNQVDLKMCVDITASILRRPSVTTVVLLTGDGDFQYLVQTLKEHGKKVLLLSAGVNTAVCLLKLCDDWIDLSGSVPSDRMLIQIWREHMQHCQYNRTDFHLAVAAFLEESAADPLLLRFLQNHALTVGILREILSVFLPIPDHKKLGYTRWADLVESAVVGTRFSLVADEKRRQLCLHISAAPSCVEGGETYSPVSLYRQVLGMDARYSSSRMAQWLKNLSRHSPKQLDELLYYVEFLKQNGLISRDDDNKPHVPSPEEYSKKVIDRLKKELRSAHYAMDAKYVSKLKEIL